MNYRLKKHNSKLRGNILLESSKSESNRVLIINMLAGGNENILNVSKARDTNITKFILKSQDKVLDVKDAGTAMRFLTAYFAIKGNGQVLTGTKRMKQRPIKPLIDALNSLGADIKYMEKEGFPPIVTNKIKEQLTNEIHIPGNVSSQYISALIMIAPCLPKGLNIKITSEIYSKPYIHMTLDLMREFGVKTRWKGNTISVPSHAYRSTQYSVEGDWSGASYWYSFIAISQQKGYLNLPDIRTYSLQGDQSITNIMYQMGVVSNFEYGKVKLLKRNKKKNFLFLDFKDYPDLAQTVMVTASAIGITLVMTGLESLKIKETDRIQAMKKELAKIGATLLESKHKWWLKPSTNLPDSVEIETYEDHRMAMAFAPLCQRMDVTIRNPSIVNKSYPGFWEDVGRLGIQIEEIS